MKRRKKAKAVRRIVLGRGWRQVALNAAGWCSVTIQGDWTLYSIALARRKLNYPSGIAFKRCRLVLEILPRRGR